MNITTEKAYVGYYATDDHYSGPPDPVGHGMTPEAAIADLREKLEDDDAPTESIASAGEPPRPCTDCGRLVCPGGCGAAA